jgi:uncharacterized protein
MHAKRNLTELETYTGQYVDLLDPQPDTIVLEDIAVGLSNVGRFAGHTNKFYSVAEHAVRVSEVVATRWALHHDSHEAYLGDITAPLKTVIRRADPYLLADLANKLDYAIGVALDIAPITRAEADAIHAADDEVLFREAAALKWSHGTGEHWNRAEAAVPFTPLGWSPDEAAARFLARDAELRAGGSGRPGGRHA